MTRYLKTALLAAAALLASCIHNDIPYPVVELRIASVEGQGFSVSETNVTSRTGTLSLDGSMAGTHVESKKSTIGEGSKVPLLSYIGDSTMGSCTKTWTGTRSASPREKSSGYAGSAISAVGGSLKTQRMFTEIVGYKNTTK